MMACACMCRPFWGEESNRSFPASAARPIVSVNCLPETGLVVERFCCCLIQTAVFRGSARRLSTQEAGLVYDPYNIRST